MSSGASLNSSVASSQYSNYSSSDSNSSTDSTQSNRSTDSNSSNAPIESRLLAKVLFVVSLILLAAPCGFVLLSSGFPYAVTCLTLGSIFLVFSSYLLCKKN